MSNDGPIFPRKSNTDEPEQESGGVVIERSDDPNFGKTTSRGRGSLPTMQGKPIGCSTGVFLLMLGIGLAGLVVSRVLL